MHVWRLLETASSVKADQSRLSGSRQGGWSHVQFSKVVCFGRRPNLRRLQHPSQTNRLTEPLAALCLYRLRGNSRRPNMVAMRRRQLRSETLPHSSGPGVDSGLEPDHPSRHAAAQETGGRRAQKEEPERLLVRGIMVLESLPGADDAVFARPCKSKKVKCGEERPGCLKYRLPSQLPSWQTSLRWKPLFGPYPPPERGSIIAEADRTL
jgi:hypothetical protein